MMKARIKVFLKRLIPVKFQPRLKTMYKTGTRISYFGFRYKCPLCNSRLRTFLPLGHNFPILKEKKVIGGGYRQNALCPICGSSDRERLLYLYLLHKTDIFDNHKKLLHVAPESKVENILRTKANIDYLTADIASKNVMVKMDITDIQFPDSSFDSIICNHVLEHIIDDGKAMSELYRTLKPGGWSILQVPLSLTLKNTYEDFSITTRMGREEAFGQGDHVRIYAEDYLDRLAQAGFKVNVFKWVTQAEDFGGRRNVFGLNEEECVYFVSKHR
jgi:predicted SAM-dependent methyltransferase